MPLSKKDGIGAWIKDFQKSDAPQFKGHSKEKRRDQAIAAYLNKEQVQENAFRSPHMSKSDVDHQKARKLMSPAKHRDDGISRIMQGMNVDKNKATKMHDTILKKDMSERVTQVSLDQAKRDLKMKKIQKSLDEISVAKRNEYDTAAKKDIERAKSSAVGKILRGKEKDGTRHDHSIELRRIARREKGRKTAMNQAIKNIRGELYNDTTTEDVSAEVKKTPIGERPKGIGWSLKKLGKQTGKEYDVWHRKTKGVAQPKIRTRGPMFNDTTTEGAFWGQDKMVKAYKDDEKKKGLVRMVKSKGNLTTTMTVKRNSADHKKYEKQGYKMDPHFKEAVTKEGADRMDPHERLKSLSAKQRAALIKGKKAGERAKVSLPHMDFLVPKKDKKSKIGRDSEVVKYEGHSLDEISSDTVQRYLDKAEPFYKRNLPHNTTSHEQKPKTIDKMRKRHKGIGSARNRQIARGEIIPDNQPNIRKGDVKRSTMRGKLPHQLPKAYQENTQEGVKAAPNLHDLKYDADIHSDGSMRVAQNSNGAIHLHGKSYHSADDHAKVAKKMGMKVSNHSKTMSGTRSTLESKINEISKKTAANLIKKRTYDLAAAGSRMTGDYGIGPEEKKKNRSKAVSQYVKYQKGVNRAVDKLTGTAKVPATESTWHMPNGKEIAILRNMMKRPIVLGENAENAIVNVPIESINLHNIFVAEAKKDPNADARSVVERWLSDRLKAGDEEAEWLGIRLGLLEGYEADVSKFMNRHGIDHHWRSGKLHVDAKDHEIAKKKLYKKYGGYGPRGALMMPQIHVNK